MRVRGGARARVCLSVRHRSDWCVCVCVCVFPEGRLSCGDQGERWRLTDQTPEPPQEDLGDDGSVSPGSNHLTNTHNQQATGVWKGVVGRWGGSGGSVSAVRGDLKMPRGPKLTLSHGGSHTAAKTPGV